MTLIKRATQSKIAITKLVKQYRSGQLPLQSVSDASKRLQNKPRQLDAKPLGQGAEGVAHLVTHPSEGIAVQKSYNTQSPVYSPELFNKKLEMSRSIGTTNPMFAKFLGQKGNLPVTYHEYVPSDKSKLTLQGATQSMRDFYKAHKTVAPTGHSIGDATLNYGNWNMQGGRPRIFDFLPQGDVVKTTPMGQLFSPEAVRKQLMDSFSARSPEMWNSLKNLDFKSILTQGRGAIEDFGNNFQKHIGEYLPKQLMNPTAIMRNAHRGL
jgi:hypothetical protein